MEKVGWNGKFMMECDGNVGNMGVWSGLVRLKLRWLSVSATCLKIKVLGGCILLIYPPLY